MNLQEIEDYLTNLALDVADGMKEPLEVYATLQAIRKAAEPLEKSIKEEAIERAIEYGADKEPVSFHGFTFSFKQGRKMPQYKENSAWVTANEEQKVIESLAKKAEAIGEPQVNPATGEFVDPVRYTYASSNT